MSDGIIITLIICGTIFLSGIINMIYKNSKTSKLFEELDELIKRGK